MTAALVVLYLVIEAITIPVIFQYVQMHFQEQDDVIIYIVANATFFLIIAVFISVFCVIINSKVKYIQYISSSVKKMEQDGFGATIEIKQDDELSELAKYINNMSITLYEKNILEKREEESKNRIIADISHDLRTPLTSVVGYLNLLKEDGFEHKELCTQYTEVIIRRIDHMTAMINQLFDYTKLIQTDTPAQMKYADITSMIHYIDYEYGYLIKKTNKRWKVECPDYPIYINMDEEKLTRALGNLLENARKYSLKDSLIHMKVEENIDTVSIEVANQTDLINEENMENIFERFYRADRSRTDNEKNGTGLGLPIVKRIVELHGGEIHAELVEQNIVFTVQLPKNT